MNKNFKKKWNDEQKRIGYWNNSFLGIMCVAFTTCVLVSIFSGLNLETLIAAGWVMVLISVCLGVNWVVGQVRLFIFFRKEVFKKEEA